MTPPPSEQVTVERPRVSRAVVACALTIGVFTVAAPLASPTVRTGIEVRWLAHELRSEDRPTRDEARRKLAAIGGRAIEPAIPELVASAVFDASPPGRPYDYWVWVFVGRVVQRDEVAHTETYEFDRWLPGAPFKGELKRRTVETPENAAPSLREPSRSREIVVVRALQHHYDSADPHERRLAVPLPEDEQGIIDAVSERLRNLRMGEHP